MFAVGKLWTRAKHPRSCVLWKAAVLWNPHKGWVGLTQFAPSDYSLILLQKKSGGRGPMTANTMRNSSMR